MQLVDLLNVFWISFAASAIVAWPIYRWLKSTVKQKIDPHAPESHQAKQGTPTMGGLIILVGAVFAIINVPPGRNVFANELITPALILLIGFGVIGFIDDFVVPRIWSGKRGLGWKQKILLELAAAFAAAQATVGGDWASYAFCIFLVVKLFNAARKRFEEQKPAPAPAGPTPSEKLLAEIRDELRAKR